MEKISIKRVSQSKTLPYIGLSIVGCAFITLCSLVIVKVYPVPLTLQTCGIFLLALTQSPRQVVGSVLCYLLCATVGLPVLCGVSNPLWFVTKCGGYLYAFPLAAYLTARMAQRWKPIIAIFCGQVLIYTFGMLWLIPFFGDQIAFKQGVLVFLPTDLLKNIMVVGIYHLWKKVWP
jgi:biotin transport system substrate-specific component